MRIVTAVIVIVLVALTTGWQAYPMRHKKHFRKTTVVGWGIACLAILASIAVIYGNGDVSLAEWLNKWSPL
jgi:hypothetical protein